MTDCKVKNYNDLRCSIDIINTHINTIKKSQQQVIKEMSQKKKEFYKRKFCKPLKQLKSYSTELLV